MRAQLLVTAAAIIYLPKLHVIAQNCVKFFLTCTVDVIIQHRMSSSMQILTSTVFLTRIKLVTVIINARHACARELL